jgi:murein DD-endopeptidase MepM/ murein hydrolase activator NlpD
VVAVFDGVVERVERDPVRGGRAGIYVIVAHGGNLVRSRYIHLDAVADGLAPGRLVRAGQPIGLLGASGILHARPHLHFGLEVGGRYVDPEPYLRRWSVPRSDTIAACRASCSSSSFWPPAPPRNRVHPRRRRAGR